MSEAHDWHVYDVENGWEVTQLDEGTFAIRSVEDPLRSVTIDSETWEKVRTGEVDERSLL